MDQRGFSNSLPVKLTYCGVSYLSNKNVPSSIEGLHSWSAHCDLHEPGDLPYEHLHEAGVVTNRDERTEEDNDRKNLAKGQQQQQVLTTNRDEQTEEDNDRKNLAKWQQQQQQQQQVLSKSQRWTNWRRQESNKTTTSVN